MDWIYFRGFITSYPNLSPDFDIYPQIYPQCLGFVLFSPQCFETAACTPMFGFCPLFTPTLLSRRAGSDVDATAAADRTQKPRRCHVSTRQNKKRRHEREREREREKQQPLTRLDIGFLISELHKRIGPSTENVEWPA